MNDLNEVCSMALRFRKSVKLAPGVRLSFDKSVSVGSGVILLIVFAVLFQMFSGPSKQTPKKQQTAIKIEKTNSTKTYAPWTGNAIEIVSTREVKVEAESGPITVQLAGIAEIDNAASRAALSNLVLNKSVKVKPLAHSSTNPVLAEIYLESGHSLGQVLISNGLAKWDGMSNFDPLLKSLEDNAKEAKKGLWAE